MHVNKFFKETNLRISDNGFEVFDSELKDKLSNIHPENFIKTRITLPVYRVEVAYITKSGNYKTSEKYMVLDNPIDTEENFSDYIADMLSRDYGEKHGFKDLHILNIWHICDSVLQLD